MNIQHTAGQQAITQMVALSPLRVWSVIITIFGDAIVPRGGVVPAATLSQLTEQMGVKPAAFRVALSRLTKDGWINRSKKGRLSFYQLSPQGAAEFGPASERIYATTPGSEQGWQLVLMPSALSDDLPQGAVGLGGRAYLAGPENHSKQGLHVAGPFTSLPDWVKTRIGPPDLAQGYAALHDTLENLPRALSNLEATTLRILIVHQWRRLILRHPDLPPHFFPDGFQCEACRGLVHTRLAQLAPASDRWFAEQL